MLTSTHVGWKMRGPQETFNKGVIDPQRGSSADASCEKPGRFASEGWRANARSAALHSQESKIPHFRPRNRCQEWTCPDGAPQNSTEAKGKTPCTSGKSWCGGFTHGNPGCSTHCLLRRIKKDGRQGERERMLAKKSQPGVGQMEVAPPRVNQPFVNRNSHAGIVWV